MNELSGLRKSSGNLIRSSFTVKVPSRFVRKVRVNAPFPSFEAASADATSEAIR
jgi:hypothetical protein